MDTTSVFFSAYSAFYKNGFSPKVAAENAVEVAAAASIVQRLTLCSLHNAREEVLMKHGDVPGTFEPHARRIIEGGARDLDTVVRIAAQRGGLGVADATDLAREASVPGNPGHSPTAIHDHLRSTGFSVDKTAELCARIQDPPAMRTPGTPTTIASDRVFQDVGGFSMRGSG